MYLDISLFIFFMVMSFMLGAIITALIFNFYDMCKKKREIITLYNENN